MFLILFYATLCRCISIFELNTSEPLFAALSMSDPIYVEVNTDEQLYGYTEPHIQIYNSLFHNISPDSAIFYAPAETPGKIEMRETTFYKCTANKRTIFDLSNYVLLDLQMVCFKTISSNVEGTVLDYTDSISETHTHNLLYLSLDTCTTTNFWIFKLWRDDPNWNSQDSLEFKFTNISHSASETFLPGSTTGIIQFCGFIQNTFQNTFANNQCSNYGLIYQKGEANRDLRFNVGIINDCNFVENIDDDNTLVFADLATITISNCHFAKNRYGINYTLWCYESIMTISGNVYDSEYLVGTANGGSYTDQGNNQKIDNPILQDFPHYANDYCEAKNKYPPTSPNLKISTHCVKTKPKHFMKYLMF